jgi:hypothetical protein
MGREASVAKRLRVRHKIVGNNFERRSTAEMARRAKGRRPVVNSPGANLVARSVPAGNRSVSLISLREVLTAPVSPRQNGYAKRVIGTLGWECLDHAII